MPFNVLIVDDSDVIRTMIARTLDLTRMPVGAVEQASNGREALAILEQRRIDLVLADINMPIMDGAEMIRSMRQREEMADVPVIVLSSEGATERVSDLMQRGVTAWVRKPFTPEELRDAIQALPTALLPESEQAAQLDAVFGEVLETFAFTYAEPSEMSDLPPAGTDLVGAGVTFTGSVDGMLTVSAPFDLCIELAANILGTDQEDPSARIRGADALGEIANIAAGHLVTMFGPARVTNLDPPIVTRLAAPEWERQAARGSARAYLVEGLPLVVALELHAPRRAS